MIFGGKSSFEVFKSKGAKMNPTWGFSSFMKHQHSYLFYCLAQSYSRILGSN